MAVVHVEVSFRVTLTEEDVPSMRKKVFDTIKDVTRLLEKNADLARIEADIEDAGRNPDT